MVESVRCLEFILVLKDINAVLGFCSILLFNSFEHLDDTLKVCQLALASVM